MSKMDDLRRMREAAHDQAMARKSQATTAKPGAAPPSAPKTSKATKATQGPKVAATPGPSSAAGECGHRSMNGRTCTREQGHAAKSHRYS